MRRFIAIAKTTALEILAEPLSLLVLTASLALAVFAPAFHYHQFGEPARMARDAGLSARMDYAGRSMKSQMKQADKANARYALILGEDELAKGVVTVRDMESSGQEHVAREDIVNKLLG